MSTQLARSDASKGIIGPVYGSVSSRPSGAGAGARPGDWMLRIVESGDVRGDGWLDLGGLREVGVVQGIRTERHLLRPFDVLVTARAGSVQVALVPPDVSRTVAGVTLLVARAKAAGSPAWATGCGIFSPRPMAAHSWPSG